MIQLEKSSTKTKTTTDFREKKTQEFLSLEDQHILQFFILGFATEMVPLEILASLNSGKSTSPLAVGH